MTTEEMFTRRAFLESVGAVTFTSKAITAPRSQTVTNIRQVGAIGDGIHNDTAAFAEALRASRSVYVPRGTYLVERILIPGGRRILTDGPPTIFKQMPGLKGPISLIEVVGSNVSIGTCNVRGNIATDEGEWRHGIFIQASKSTGDLTNITIGTISGVNLRGDVVYVGTRDNRSVARIQAASVRGNNILRNVVSIVGGREIRIKEISGSRVGYTHLDIEPDDWNGPVSDVTVGSVVGGFVQVAGQSPASSVDQVRIERLNLQSPVPRSDPLYQPGASRSDALTIRNVRFLDIGQLSAKGFDGHAIKQIWDPGALTDQRVHIAQVDISDCARDPRRAQAYILGSRRATRLRMDQLTVDSPRPGLDIIRDCKEAEVGRVRGKLSKRSRLIAQSNNWIEEIARDGAPAPALVAALRTP